MQTLDPVSAWGEAPKDGKRKSTSVQRMQAVDDGVMAAKRGDRRYFTGNLRTADLVDMWMLGYDSVPAEVRKAALTAIKNARHGGR